MNSQKTYASAVKGVKQESQSKQESPIKQEIPKPYCECCRKIVKALEFNGKIVKAVEFKEWCNMFMCDDCENWIMAHGV